MSDTQPTLNEAIDIVARQLIANAAAAIAWGDSPNIGMHDWDEITDRIEELAGEPYNFDKAITLLESRGIGDTDDK